MPFKIDENADPFDVSRADLYADDTWHPVFRELRAIAPVYRVGTSSFGPYWAVSSYRTIVEVESLPDLFSSEAGGFTILPLRPPEQRLPMFIARDGSVHADQRRTVAPAFSRSEVERLSADLRRRTACVLDALPLGETFDWVSRVSIELTTQMLTILLDLPWEERGRLADWSDWMGSVEIANDPVHNETRLTKLREAGARFRTLWHEKAAKPPASDLISLMAHSRSMGGIDEREFLGTILLLIVGGSDTTRNTMSGLVYAGHRFPGERAKLEADPRLIPNAVSETIRWQTPIAHMARTATRDAVLDGRHIAAGDKLVLWYLSGNRDSDVFGADADDWRVERSNARRHLAFGHGVHRCIGARLAELQVGVLMEEMSIRRLRANVVDEPERTPSCFIHGFTSMPVALTRY